MMNDSSIQCLERLAICLYYFKAEINIFSAT